MITRSSVHTGLLFGIPTAVFVGVITSVPFLLPTWNESRKIEAADCRTAPTSVSVLRTIDEKTIGPVCHCPLHETSWTDVLDFLSNELMKVDPEWWLLSGCLLVMLLQEFVKKKPQQKDHQEDPQIVEKASIRVDDSVVGSPLGLRERALLQFQRNRSEPVDFRYGHPSEQDGFDLDISESTFNEFLQRFSAKSILSSRPSIQMSPDRTQQPERKAATFTENRTHGYQGKPLGETTGSGAASSSVPSSSTNPASVTLSISSPHDVLSRSSENSLNIYFTPQSHSLDDNKAIVTQEQVYSQPFNY
ncbi:LAMI_0C00980g1_1 [Lachancea mirantina]|uniref:LAMI_0C00980g1_1 n=1 Tax=Lachancea mirantina TaxID=1230905 RepID=A0A1G4IZZ4_9SACH|nr:LAMI_0C00980g1_1 [Lachancea mirantina]